MPFSYYARLTRAQQVVYRKSDAITEVRLPRPEALYPSVDALASALASEDRAGTQAATDRLVRGLTEALRLPPVRVEVLAARPHARWGELHGLYTAQRGKPPTIQLWMRTAKQKRVVAFRTYLRTLLHEVGHHVDYTGIRLQESYHTEGFYRRESSLFHQLITDRETGGQRRTIMATTEHWATQSREERMKRLERTADELTAALKGQPALVLTRRPDPKNWAPVEVLCHLRDIEETFLGRFETILAQDDPKFLAVDPDRWATERQYLRNDAGEAVAAFRKRRQESLAWLRRLTPDQFERGGIHATRGRLTIDNFLTMLAWHDDNHLDQLKRGLEGRP